MSNRSYCSLSEFKANLGVTSSTDDVAMLKVLEASTTAIEKYLNRRFQPEYGTKYFTGANRIWFKPDLLSASTVKLDEDGNASFESTLTTSDYVLFPLNEFPKTYMEIGDNSDYGSFAYGYKKGVEIVGEWGFGDGESASPYTEQSKTVASMTTTASTQGVVSTNLATGQTWLVDSEQMYIKDLTGSVATIVRALNGTSATSHVASSTIYVYDYPADIKQACLDISTATWNTRNKQGIQSENIGDYGYNLRSPYSEGGKIKSTVQSILDSQVSQYRKVQV